MWLPTDNYRMELKFKTVETKRNQRRLLLPRKPTVMHQPVLLKYPGV